MCIKVFVKRKLNSVSVLTESDTDLNGDWNLRAASDTVSKHADFGTHTG